MGSHFQLSTFNSQLKEVPSPCFVLDESALKRNLAVIDRVRAQAGVEIIVALKACAMWSIFSELARHSDGATASSANEARLVFEEFGWADNGSAGVFDAPGVGQGSGKTQKPYGTKAHTYAPSYSDVDFDEIARCSSHITFNSLGQFERFGARARAAGISCGLRVNPGWSPVETALYNPALPGSRLGVERLETLPEGIEGLHFHVLCESGAADLARALEAFEGRFGHLLGEIKWLNCGGGHLITREGYDIELLVNTLRDFRSRHPHLRVILEPGSAFTWRTGVLVSQIEDLVVSGGDSRSPETTTKTAMLDVSFACHMPDCLEMPYKPAIVGARDTKPGETGWRMGGSSCLAGDYMGDWTFVDPDGKPRDPAIGERVVFEDMIHYTMVKTTMFNGVRHPGIAIARENGDIEIVRRFGYEDYKNRMG